MARFSIILCIMAFAAIFVVLPFCNAQSIGVNVPLDDPNELLEYDSASSSLPSSSSSPTPQPNEVLPHETTSENIANNNNDDNNNMIPHDNDELDYFETPSSASLRNDVTVEAGKSICDEKFVPVLRDLITNAFALDLPEIKVTNLEIAQLSTSSCGVTLHDNEKLSILKVLGIQATVKAKIAYELGEKDKKPIMKDQFTVNVNIPSAAVTGYIWLVDNDNENNVELEKLNGHVMHRFNLDDNEYMAFTTTEIHELNAKTADSIWAGLYNSLLVAANGPIKVGLSVLANNYLSKVLKDKWNESADVVRSLSYKALDDTKSRDNYHIEDNSNDDYAARYELDKLNRDEASQPSLFPKESIPLDSAQPLTNEDTNEGMLLNDIRA